MSTGLIIALIVIAAVVVIIAAVMTLRARGPRRGPSLKRRFGPEYDRAVARHDGDAKAAERELTERVQRHGDLRERSLEPAQREQYEARWTAAQERFVDSPREAVAEADRLLSELAGARGFPDGGQYEEQLAALSVHHAHHVDGYRRVHRAAHLRAEDARDGGQGTEDMREAMVAARALFEELVKPARHNGGHTGARHEEGRHDGHHRAGLNGGRKAPARGGHTPWAINRRQAKES
ncbi:hypothetical protein [Streptomyces hawaiiensis]|uniref:Secreted protein n=1 Tax=Streptomyces hawaiiensis TaxID=67305 RepID=A0A6G5RDF0_9ACTN|nr:hypothetical protein [Streptomyces hawaiiensis]QCD55627.1 hypothetical protein CEB94_12635 [Streptomyces hawaiiensis]